MALAYYHVTTTGAGAKTGAAWATAMDLAAFETHIEGSSAAGDTYFIAGGTYTLSGSIDFSARTGSITSPISIIGVNAGTTNEGANIVYADWATTAANRPFLDCVTYQFKCGDRVVVRNIYFQGSASNTFISAPTYGTIITNCKFDNDYGSSAARYIVSSTGYSLWMDCEFSSAKTKGFCHSSIQTVVLFCYFHDINDATNGIGLDITTSGGYFFGNIFNNCTVGISLSTSNYTRVINNTLYDCDTGISGSTGGYGIFINNLIDSSATDGIKWTTQTDSNFFWKNHGSDARNNDMWDGVDVTTIFQDYLVSAGDPLFHSAGTDFAISAGSPCLGNGASITQAV